MRVLDSDLYAEYQKEILRYFFMVEFDFTSTYRYNDTDETIYDSSSNAFLSRGFSFEDISFGVGMTVSELNITIDDTDQLISAILLGEDVRNCTAKLYIGVVTAAADPNPSEIITQEFMRGIVSGWELSGDNVAKITIKNEMVLWSKKTLRTCQASCPWLFKGTECTYSGDESWCDQSYDRCSELVNTDNFGGFRFLPSLMQKEIWWGRNPKYTG